MEVPTRIHNAIIILSFLAGYKGKYAASLSSICNDLKLPHTYLEQIMPLLRQANLVKSYRGSAGGYRLAKKAKTISFLDVIFALEGGMRVASCVAGGKCKKENKCPSKKIHIKLQNELNDSLDKIKISDFR